MDNGHIHGPVSIDRDSAGALLLADNHIVISDRTNDVVCLVPYEPDGDECAEYERLAETIVARLNAPQPEAPTVRDLEAAFDVPSEAGDEAILAAGEACAHPEYYTINAALGQHRCLGCGYQFTDGGRARR